MPAYRSNAEAEIRDEVVKTIRLHRPNARIIHEINVSSHGPNRMDLIAVDRAEIIAFEIKSAKDKLGRLPDQMKAMKNCATYAIAAIHEKFLVAKECNSLAAEFEKDGKHWRRCLPHGFGFHNSEAWVYPIMRRAPANWYDELEKWRFPDFRPQTPLPYGALNLLWRKELYNLCGALKVPASSRSDTQSMRTALRWLCNGGDLTKGICTALRTRNCTEADAPVFEAEIREVLV